MIAVEATTRLRLGTTVLNNDSRHPVLVAREATTDLPAEIAERIAWRNAEMLLVEGASRRK